MIALSNIFKFVQLTHQLQQVRRAILVNGEERQENDLEHSCQLALLGWYIINAQELELNSERVIIYALIHDVIEGYAGDTPFYADDQRQQEQRRREQEAQKRLQKEFPEFTQLHEMIARYEAREEPEARFVYVLDKLIPAFNVYLDGGRSLKKFGISFETVVRRKTPYVRMSPELQPLFEAMMDVLEKEKERLFPAR